jgi:hypothetical protein
MALISKARSRLLVFAAVATTTLALGFAAPATASLIEYTETATGSGTLNGIAFTNDLITITAFGDTTGVITVMPAPGGFFVNPGVVATVTVSGIGSDTLPNAVVFVIQAPPLGPFCRLRRQRPKRCDIGYGGQCFQHLRPKHCHRPNYGSELRSVLNCYWLRRKLPNLVDW